VPEARLKRGVWRWFSAVPPGRGSVLLPYPELKRLAIVERPSGRGVEALRLPNQLRGDIFSSMLELPKYPDEIFPTSITKGHGRNRLLSSHHAHLEPWSASV